MSNKGVAVYAEALKREQEIVEETSDTSNGTLKATRKVTPKRDQPREKANKTSREKTRDGKRKQSRDGTREIVSDTPEMVAKYLPTRDEIQEFSFQLRDELKVKVQAEVPHLWQKELEETSRELNVKKLELYRYIIGEFLGKVERKPTS
ncbi:hypothetical protein ACFLYO_04875 [Chloroflexota bacterium]